MKPKPVGKISKPVFVLDKWLLPSITDVLVDAFTGRLIVMYILIGEGYGPVDVSAEVAVMDQGVFLSMLTDYWSLNFRSS